MGVMEKISMYALMGMSLAVAALMFSITVNAVAGADNGNGNGKDCMNQTQVETIVNEQIQNVTETTQNQTLTEVITIINSTENLDNDTKSGIIDQIQDAIEVDVVIAKNETATDQNNVLTFEMNTTGIPKGNYELYQNGEPASHRLDVKLADGIPEGKYNVTRVE